ncbi:MAG: class I SAM-dependent methyltransferase [Candidatus Hodarchaeales archaeon]|jgi:ubiquinone/menaquinone biosynthesis C-methylase UbiE
MKFSNYTSTLRYFDEYDEWNRLFKDSFHQLEWLVTFHHLHRFLAPASKILDAGGGPGRYSFKLADEGHNITLFDLSPRLLGIAKEKLLEQPWIIRKNLEAIIEGSITKLCFAEESFDAVLALHPLSYLIELKEREIALMELKRVLKSGGLLVLGVINKYGNLRNQLKNNPETLFFPEHQELFISGIHRAHNSEPDIYFFTPHELKNWVEGSGFKTLDMAATEGLSGGLREATNLLSENRDHWKKWVQLIIETSNDPSIWGCAEHFIYFGQKE